MERYTPQDGGIILSMYLTNNRSLVLAQRAFRRRFPNRIAPTGQTLRGLAARLKETGTTKDLAERGRHQTGRSVENIAAVAGDIAVNQETLTIRRATQLVITRRTLQRILVKNLHMLPYKVQIMHQLMPCDRQSRVNYCQAILNLNNEADDFVSKIIMSHEAHFQLSGYVNKQNLHFWGIENLRVMHEEPLHPLKATVWCSVHAGGVIGPGFFEDAVSNTVTVTSIALINDFNARIGGAGLGEHVVSTRRCNSTHSTSHNGYCEGIAAWSFNLPFDDLAWPASSPALTAPDFYLWGYLKSRLYVNKPQTIAALEKNIRQECEEILPEILRKVMENAIKRAQTCINSGGSHLMDIIFSTYQNKL
nr:unnamed protein product [Callosobruchus chinensis]